MPVLFLTKSGLLSPRDISVLLFHHFFMYLNFQRKSKHWLVMYRDIILVTHIFTVP